MPSGKSEASIKRIAAVLLIVSGAVSVPFLRVAFPLAIFRLYVDLMIVGLYLLPWLAAVYIYSKGYFRLASALSVLIIVIIGPATVYSYYHRAYLQHYPAAGLLVPTEASYPDTMTAEGTDVYADDWYSVGRHDPSDDQQRMGYEERTDRSDIAEFAFLPTEGNAVHTFDLNGAPATIYSRSTGRKGHVDYVLLSTDGDKYLRVEYQGRASDMTPVQMEGFVRTMMRSTLSAPAALAPILNFGKKVCNISGVGVCL